MRMDIKEDEIDEIMISHIAWDLECIVHWVLQCMKLGSRFTKLGEKCES